LPLEGFVAVDKTNVWEVASVGLRKHVLKCDHTGGCAIKWKSEILIISGCNTTETETFSLINHEIVFSKQSELCTQRHRYDAAVVNVKETLYVTGGLSTELSAECLNTNSSYVNKNRSVEFKPRWEGTSALQFNRHGHALAYFVHTIYCIGGNVKSATETSTSAFSRNLFGDQSLVGCKMLDSLGTVETFAPMSVSRSHLAAVVFNERIYAIGGTSNQKISAVVVEAYHPLSNKWNTVASLNVARCRPGACVIDNQIVVVGGGSNVVEVYDAKKNVWKIVGKCEELKDVFAIFAC